MSVEKIYYDKIQKLEGIITALCDNCDRCTVCYRLLENMTCSGCKEYYTDCNCKSLSPDDIINWSELTKGASSHE